jgi:hypothetical protein
MIPPDQNELILRFSRRTPRHANESMIPSSTLSQPLPVNLQPPQYSSLGSLDCLPVEILHNIFDDLDFRSLFRLAATSHYGRWVVHSHPLFHILVNYAYHALVALSQTQVIQWHTSSTLYDALRAEKCVSCGDYGPFLFLATCERCCYWCLHENQALWLVPLSKIKKLLGLKEREIKGVPVLRSLHGEKFIPPIRRGARERLVAVKTIKRIAVAAHGSEVQLASFIREQKYSIKDKYLALWISNAPLEPLPANPSRLPARKERPQGCDRHEGMASIIFPTMYGKSAEYGYWCLGCQALFNDTLLPSRWLDGMARQARSRSEFAEHVMTCVGVQKLLSDDKRFGPWRVPILDPPASSNLYGEF